MDSLTAFPLSFAETATAWVAVIAGAVLQSATGLGGGLVMAPILLMIDPVLVPGPLLASSLALSSVMAVRGRAHVSYGRLNPVLAGLVAGSALAIAVLDVVGGERTRVLFGLMLLLAVAVSAVGRTVVPNRRSMLLAGTVSAFIGTIAAIGGPFLALLFQRESGPVIRATLGYLFFVATVIMLAFLWWGGHFGLVELWASLALVPGWIAGYFLSPRIATYLDAGRTRIAILSVSGASGIFLLVRELL